MSEPVLAPAGVRRRSRRALARSTAGDRWLVALAGLLLLVAGTLTALLSYGVFGTGRSDRPLLDPVVVDTLRAHPLPARLVALGVGVLLTVLGVALAVRSLRPERRPDLMLDADPGTAVVIRSAAAAEAVTGAAAALPGVARARTRLVGAPRVPAMRLTLWLEQDADVTEVCRRLELDVLTEARTCLGVADLPVGVRLELDSSSGTPRVV
ncbi:alkaline shock response membrane anchor protein AmaP [Pseudonocardia hispaniensis]|uniref:Alkaline shock response membrane anchor protein AmaP n=1 Tax=Pseudonocardia hispaniensis TaxID=904933 RepID=A0ABW1J2F1_9PSEU